jgi:Bacterial Ig-like domain (group 3)/Beta-propeller repeat
MNQSPSASPLGVLSPIDAYAKLALSFEANHGQTDAQVKFLTRTTAYALFLTQDEAVLTTRDRKAVLRMKFRNANPAAKVTGTDELAGRSNYFIGNDPAKWQSNVPTYAKVKYAEIYSGIDLVYYGNQHELEYDFIVAPGADPRRIAFDIHGAKRILQSAHGDLVLKVDAEEIRCHKPVVYQTKNGTRHEIAARYAITDKNRVGFELAKYDASLPLYIDPLIYSTYLGGSSLDGGNGIAIDSAGSAYVTGTTYSTNFPTTPGALETTCKSCGANNGDVFVTKFSPSGSALVYSTYLGGSGNDYGIGVAVDGAGNAYVIGQTTSTNFPTKNPLQRTYGGGSYDAFVAKINPSGSALVYSTYLGGNTEDLGQAIAVDAAGNAYVTGQTDSTNFPTMRPLQAANAGGRDAFVAKINSKGSQLVYSTYLGGSNLDYGVGIAVDNAGNAYVTGSTYSTDFPTKNPLQAALAGSWDAFVTKINPSGSSVVYSTYLGGGGGDDVGGSGYGIAVDSAGGAYVTGYTISSTFPTTPGAFQTTYAGNWDAVVSKLDPTGSTLVYSTYLGGSDSDVAWSIALDSQGDAYVSGSTSSKDFPTVNPFQKHRKGGGDAFVSKLNSSGSALLYSTYLGGNGAEDAFGIAVDSAGHAYVTGDTSSTNFPTVSPVQPNLAGGTYDAFVTEIDVSTPTTTTVTSSSNPSAHGQPVTFTATVTSDAGAPPDGETVTFMRHTTMLGTGTLSGGSAMFTTSTLKVGKKSIRAEYAGDASFAGSKSGPLKQVVEKSEN